MRWENAQETSSYLVLFVLSLFSIISKLLGNVAIALLEYHLATNERVTIAKKLAQTRFLKKIGLSQGSTFGQLI